MGVSTSSGQPELRPACWRPLEIQSVEDTSVLIHLRWKDSEGLSICSLAVLTVWHFYLGGGCFYSRFQGTVYLCGRNMRSHCIFSQETGVMSLSVLIKTAGQVKRETHLPQEAHAMHQTIPERTGKCCKSASALDISNALSGIQTIHPQLQELQS